MNRNKHVRIESIWYLMQVSGEKENSISFVGKTPSTFKFSFWRPWTLHVTYVFNSTVKLIIHKTQYT